MVETQLVLCPETGRREEIERVVARDGEVLVVLRCTRFDPCEAVTCTAPCVTCQARACAPDPWQIPHAPTRP